MTNSVLEVHHHRNHPNRPPHPSRLAQSAAHQGGGHTPEPQVPATLTPLNSTSLTEDSDDDELPTHTKRAPRHSKSKKADPKPTHLSFYPKTWQSVLDKTKLSLHRHLALNRFFPDKHKHSSEIYHLLTEQIAHAKDNGFILDESMLLDPRNMSTTSN